MSIEQIKKIISEAKYVIATIGVIVTSLVGAYNLAGDYFVTTAWAQEMERNTNAQVQELKLLNQQNTMMILDLRLLRFEQKLEIGVLSATEQREYDYLKRQLDVLRLGN